MHAAALALAAPAAASPRLTPADRAAITRSIDVFVNHAVKRANTGAAFDVVAPEMRPGITRKQWKDVATSPPTRSRRGARRTRGTSSTSPRKRSAWSWSSSPRQGVTEQGPIIFHIYLRPVRGGRWLVDSFMPVATLAPLGAKQTKVRSVRDFSPERAAAIAHGGGPQPASAETGCRAPVRR